MTTNEQLNWRRYEYFKSQTGLFHNPFNRGLKQNLREFFHLQRTVEDITSPESVMSVWISFFTVVYPLSYPPARENSRQNEI